MLVQRDSPPPAGLRSSCSSCLLRRRLLVFFHAFPTLCESVLVAQLCPTLCDPVDCSPPDSSVHGSLQARILEWVAISFSRGSSIPRDQTWVSALQADSLPSEPSEKPLSTLVEAYIQDTLVHTLLLPYFCSCLSSPILSSISSPILLSYKIKEK